MMVNNETPTRRRGRPAKTNQAEIIAAALALGLDTFSLDDVADQLGITTPALYSHVNGRDHILRLAAAEILMALEPDLCDLDNWQTWLRLWATEIRERLGAVGEEVLEAVRTTVDPTTLSIADHGLGLMIAAGLDPADAGYALWLTVRTACTAGPLNRPSVQDPATQARLVATSHHSDAMTLAINAVTTADRDAAFEFDLDVLIGGLLARCTG